MTATSFFRKIMVVVWVFACFASAIVLFMFLGAVIDRAASVPAPGSILAQGPMALAEVFGFFLIAPAGTIWLGLRLILARRKLTHWFLWAMGGIAIVCGFVISLLLHGAVETTIYRVVGLLGLIAFGHWLATRDMRPEPAK